MKTDLEKVESVQYHCDHIRDSLVDYYYLPNSITNRRAKQKDLVDRMAREEYYINQFLADKDICSKVCDDFLAKLNNLITAIRSCEKED